jgi:hypothetical protein
MGDAFVARARSLLTDTRVENLCRLTSLASLHYHEIVLARYAENSDGQGH